MKQRYPNYVDIGFANRMGPQLRNEVEQQLLEDLRFYKVKETNLKFDWSESCVEGHCMEILDGEIENFSGIVVFNGSNELVANCWMEFICENDFLIVYWQFVTTWNGKIKLKEKKERGVPNHIWKKLLIDIKSKYRKLRVK